MAEQRPIIEMRGISKGFPGVQALSDVDFTVAAGEVHALVGENGAGKSTLMKILAGAIAADSGTILVDGREVTFRRPVDSMRAGISTIYQELLLCRNLSVADNVFLGREATRATWIREDVLAARSRDYLRMLGLEVDPTTPVSLLTVAQQQMVEIAKALSVESRVIVMDEPTAALTQRETENLFRALALLKEQGRSIVYISHRLEEVFRVADRVTVLRDGRRVGEAPTGELTEGRLVEMMVGRELEQELFGDPHGARPRPAGPPLLEVRNLSRIGAFEDVSFAVYPGEVVGFSGLIGAGRTELMRAIFGVDRPTSGTIERRGKPVRIASPRDAIRHGIGMTTEDRKYDGLFPNFRIRENASVATLETLSASGFVRPLAERRTVSAVVKELDVRPPQIERLMINLSGGNQQKVTLARWLLTKPEVLILDEPTRGVDVGAKAEIRRIILRLADEGKGVVLVSSELPELLSTADRILVMRRGRLVADLPARETTQEEIMTHAVVAPSEPVLADPEGWRANL